MPPVEDPEQPAEAAEASPEFSAQGADTESNQDPEEVQDVKVDLFDVRIELKQEEKDGIVQYLEGNLPRLKPDDEDVNKIKGYFAIYDMAARKRSFPYENAPSLASTDAHDRLNKFLDVAEQSFLGHKVTFTLDRDEISIPEDAANRIEKTYHRRFTQKVLEEDLRMFIFEGAYLGTSFVSVRENWEIEPVREKFICKTPDDINNFRLSMTGAQIQEATKKVEKGDIYLGERESIKMHNVGPRPARIDQTKFWFPRNTKKMSEWQIVAEQEFYTKGALQALAQTGEIDEAAVNEAIANRRALYQYEEKKKGSSREALPPAVKCNTNLDSNWSAEMETIKTMGDTYEDEFAVYRVTMRYGIKTDANPTGQIKSWIEVMYCPASSSILSAKFCQYGFPYFLVRYRPVPYRVTGIGIAQERYNHNLLDSDLKSLFLASTEQGLGSPVFIRKNSSLYASGFRCYPNSIAYVDDVDRDAKYFPYPDKSRFASEAMSMVLGSSPMQNAGLGYSSGKRQEVMQQEETRGIKSRVYSMAVDLDKIFNFAWRIHCQLAKFNTKDEKIVSFVCDQAPVGSKLYILESEMNASYAWSSILTATSLTPDARLADAMKKYQFFFKDQPSMVNNPQKTIAWLQYMSDFFGLDESLRDKLLPSEQDFQQYQQSLAQQGGGAQQAQGNAMTAQSPSTPFQRPAGPSTPTPNGARQ